MTTLLKLKRTQIGLSQIALSQKSKVAQCRISLIERRRVVPSPVEAKALADAVQIRETALQVDSTAISLEV